MIVLWILMSVFFLLILWLLWVPLRVCINTYQNDYFVAVGRWFKVSPVIKEEGLRVRLKIPFGTFYVSPKKRKTKKTGKIEKRSPTANKKLGSMPNLRLVKALFGTFTMRKCLMDLDTDDYVLNAQLIPLMIWLPFDVTINFQGKVGLWVEVENRLVRVVRVLILYKLNKI